MDEKKILNFLKKQGKYNSWYYNRRHRQQQTPRKCCKL